MRRKSLLAAAAGLLALAAASPTGAAAAAPQPCLGVPQIVDASGDGHHPGTDVLAAWFSEQDGGLQAVIQVSAGIWVPEHADEEVNEGGYALVFTAGGQARYVRARAAEDGALTYDYGLYPAPGVFSSQGTTTGEVSYAPQPGTVTIDVPAATGATPGQVLTDSYALTYDGLTGGVPHWVDHGPGGELPTDPARGADYSVGSCSVVSLTAPAVITGGGTIQVSGDVAPPAAGLAVELTKTALSVEVLPGTTAADGSFTFPVTVSERTSFRAKVGGVNSQTVTVDVQAVVTAKLRRFRSGRVIVRGRTRPALPGRVLLLAKGQFKPRAKKSVRDGAFKFAFGPARLTRGSYQVVYIPQGDRARRDTSNAVRMK